MNEYIEYTSIDGPAFDDTDETDNTDQEPNRRSGDVRERHTDGS